MWVARTIAGSAGLLFVLLLIAMPAQAILVGPGVVFMSEVGVEYRFSVNNTFQRIFFADDTRLRLDAVILLFESPGGRMWANISGADIVNPTAGILIVAEWLGTTNYTGASWQNISGLQPGAEYSYAVDGVLTLSLIADLGGNIYIQRNSTAFDPHTFSVTTPYAAIAPADWLLMFLIFAVVFLTILGLVFDEWGWFCFIFAGIAGMVLAIELVNLTGSDLAAGLCFAIGAFLILIGAYDALNR